MVGLFLRAGSSHVSKPISAKLPVTAPKPGISLHPSKPISAAFLMSKLEAVSFLLSKPRSAKLLMSKAEAKVLSLKVCVYCNRLWNFNV
jgi:hypothetical protein